MIEIKNEFSIEQLAKANIEMKKKYKILSLIIIIISIISLAISLVMTIGLNNDNNLWYVLMGVSAFLLIFFAYLYFILTTKVMTNRLLKINPKLHDGILYIYNFSDDELILTKRTLDFESTNNMKYSSIFKYVMTKNYLFIFINTKQAYPIYKDDLNKINNVKKLLDEKLKK